MTRITLLTGGTSTERDVALASAAQVIVALRSRGHEVSVVDTAKGYIPQSEEPSLIAGTVGREPPPLADLRTLERGLLLSREVLPVPLETGKRLKRRHQASAAPSSSR